MFKSEDEYETLITFIIALRTGQWNHRHTKQEWKAIAEKQANESNNQQDYNVRVYIHRKMSKLSNHLTD